MALIQLRDAHKYYFDKIILSGVSLQIQRGEKVGLIGLNGTGKTTLLRILAGREPLEAGELIRKKDLTVGYMDQDFFSQDGELTIYDFLLEVFTHLREMERELRRLEDRMGADELRDRPGEMERVMSRYTRLSRSFKELGGYEYTSRIRGVLNGLGFESGEFERCIGDLSGGEKSRLALGRLLLKRPGLLLLDEPTNHLDIPAQEWLEDHLAGYSGAVIVITHDRYFLDRIADRILELNQGRLDEYPGDYRRYLQEREKRLLSWRRRYERQQEEIATKEEFIRRNIAGVRSRQAQSRRKELERMKRIPPPPREPPLPGITFPAAPPSGKEVLGAEDIHHAYSSSNSSGSGGGEVLAGVSFRLFRGERVALIGRNGCGKTTLFRIITGELEPVSGSLHFGTGVRLTYYSQEHGELEPENNVLDELLRAADMGEERARSILGRFRLSESECEKKVRELSGGERSRLALARLTLRESNLLLMDEPTNHLDALSRGVLEGALRDYPGTLLIISHDRYLIDRIAGKLWVLGDDGRLTEHRGGYTSLRERAFDEGQRGGRGDDPGGHRGPRSGGGDGSVQNNSRGDRSESEPGSAHREVEDLEEEIQELEGRIAALEREFSDPLFYRQDGAEIESKNRSYSQLKRRLERLYQIWESAL